VELVTHQLTLISTQNPNTVPRRPAVGVPALAGLDSGQQDALSFMLGKQLELEGYKQAAREFRAFCQRMAARNDAPAREAEQVLVRTALEHLDVLPVGWEAMATPEGLVYFVDHQSKTTSWSHPGLSHRQQQQQQSQQQQGVPSYDSAAYGAAPGMPVVLQRTVPDDDARGGSATMSKLQRAQQRQKATRRADNFAR
jgi:hypothetical protein